MCCLIFGETRSERRVYELYTARQHTTSWLGEYTLATAGNGLSDVISRLLVLMLRTEERASVLVWHLLPLRTRWLSIADLPESIRATALIRCLFVSCMLAILTLVGRVDPILN